MRTGADKSTNHFIGTGFKESWHLVERFRHGTEKCATLGFVREHDLGGSGKLVDQQEGSGGAGQLKVSMWTTCMANDPEVGYSHWKL